MFVPREWCHIAKINAKIINIQHINRHASKEKCLCNCDCSTYEGYNTLAPLIIAKNDNNMQKSYCNHFCDCKLYRTTCTN